MIQILAGFDDNREPPFASNSDMNKTIGSVELSGSQLYMMNVDPLHTLILRMPSTNTPYSQVFSMQEKNVQRNGVLGLTNSHRVPLAEINNYTLGVRPRLLLTLLGARSHCVVKCTIDFASTSEFKTT